MDWPLGEKCEQCDGPLVLRRSGYSEEESYRYLLSGVPDVYLCDVDVICCDTCKYQLPSLEAPGKLHELIAEELVLYPTRLPATYIKFLRKFAGFGVRNLVKLLRFVTEAEFEAFENNVAIDPGSSNLIESIWAIDTTVRLLAIQVLEDPELLTKLTNLDVEGLPRRTKLFFKRSGSGRARAWTVALRRTV